MYTIIFANGDFRRPTNPLANVHRAELLVAADGGTHHCQELGVRPDVVVGDMDSISVDLQDTLEEQGTRFIVHPTDKDETDLELALSYAIDNGARQILLLGLLGGRLDQTLANLLLLTRPEWQSARLTAADGPDFAVLLRSGESFNALTRPGDTLSLIALSREVSGVTTRGLKWPLENATLKFGSTLGVSNQAGGDRAKVTIAEGQLLVVHRIGEQGPPESDE
ncbi:MAG TPA: thiamine diphosphokinase [Anaerolineales bacterium]|nr:thiamine diphosphokinase [Anaerolineales bacterium]